MFTSIDQTSVFQAIQDQIRSLIREGQLTPGSRLPPEKELMEQLGVGRPTPRKAPRTIVGAGLLEV